MKNSKRHFSRLFRPGAAGLAFGLAGLGVSLVFLRGVAAGWQVFLFCAPLAAFGVGFLAWSLLLARWPQPRPWAGAAAGALVGFLAHPAAWYLAILYFYFSGATSSLGEPTLDPVVGLPASLLYSALSWLAAGWLTVPAGALIGGLLAYFQGWPGRIPANGEKILQQQDG